MAIKRRALRKRTFSKKRKVVRKALRKARDFNIRRIARRELRRQIEDKEQRFNSEGFFYNYMGTASWESGNIYDVNYHIGQNITQGTGQGQRIGNKIRVTKYNIKYRFWANTPNFLNNCYLKLFIVSDKRNPNTCTVGDISTAVLNGPWFNNGSGSTGMTQKVYDTMMPVDRDRWRVHKQRMWKIGVSSNPQGAVTGYGNNDFKYSGVLNINLSKFMPKVLQFLDTSTTINSRNTFLVFQVVKADNTIDAVNTAHLAWSRVVEMKFEDA